MSIELVIRMTQELFLVALLVALPALVVSLVVGLVVSIFQTVTSIQDQTLSYVPRIILVGLALVVTLGVSFQQAVAFTKYLSEKGHGRLLFRNCIALPSISSSIFRHWSFASVRRVIVLGSLTMISWIVYPRIWNKFKIAIGGYHSFD